MTQPVEQTEDPLVAGKLGDSQVALSRRVTSVSQRPAALDVATMLEAAEAFTKTWNVAYEERGLAIVSSVIEDINDHIARQFLKQTYTFNMVKKTLTRYQRNGSK
ncbi:hypothetical protein HDU86_006342 [Geranomyces michiganensis]|nr:hypothetical protein HDU86_006342 [Geranomyces michiganensis]